MTSTTISPSIDQGAKLIFQDNFFELAQQTNSKLAATGAITYLPAMGKTNNMARIGRIELTEVNTRNPDKQYGEYSLDNRQFTKRRFTRTVQIDAKYDINELLKDPTSNILKELNNAKERVIDRIAVTQAIGSVLTGAPDAAATTTSAATDGVITVDATSGLTYEKIQEITQNFINNDLPYDLIQGSTLCVTGAENSDLMSEVEFINNDYIDARPVSDGVVKKAGTYNVVLFAGSVTGGITVSNPILTEATTTRSCVVMTKDSVAMAMELGDMGVEKATNKVNSYDITIDFWINAMRTEGVRVQVVTTTM